MQSKTTKTYVLTALIILGFGLVFVLSDFLEKNRPVMPESYEDSDLAVQGGRLKGFVFGFEGLVADWYWIKSLQYVGDKVIKSDQQISLDDLSKLNPRLLYPYLDNATTLDPQFTSVYEYGAIVLPSIDREQAINLTLKGIRDNPNDWRLYQHLGFIYWRFKDYEKAAEYYEAGARLPDAPDFVKLMAARVRTDGGSRAVARQVYRQMSETAADINIRNNALLRLAQLDSLDERETIQKALNEFQAKNNRCPNNWRELFSSFKTLPPAETERLRFDKSFAPIDPKDFPYRLDAKNCQPQLSPGTTIPLD